MHGSSSVPKELINKIFTEFQPDVVVHAAASYKDPDDWYSDVLTNCLGGVNVISSSAKNNVKRFIYFQTALCYGIKPNQQPITLDHPIKPNDSSYAISKTTNEMYLELSGLNYVTFRLANVIGPRNLSGPLPIFYQRLIENKKCFITKSRRDFVYVKDLSRIALEACYGKGNGSYHFSSGKDIAIEDLYYAVLENLNLNRINHEPEIRELSKDDVFSILLDPSRTFEDFGKIKFSSLKTIVDDAVQYYKEYGTAGEFTHLKEIKDT